MSIAPQFTYLEKVVLRALGYFQDRRVIDIFEIVNKYGSSEGISEDDILLTLRTLELFDYASQAGGWWRRTKIAHDAWREWN